MKRFGSWLSAFAVFLGVFSVASAASAAMDSYAYLVGRSQGSLCPLSQTHPGSFELASFTETTPAGATASTFSLVTGGLCVEPLLQALNARESIGGHIDILQSTGGATTDTTTLSIPLSGVLVTHVRMQTTSSHSLMITIDIVEPAASAPQGATATAAAAKPSALTGAVRVLSPAVVAGRPRLPTIPLDGSKLIAMSTSAATPTASSFRPPFQGFAKLTGNPAVPSETTATQGATDQTLRTNSIQIDAQATLQGDGTPNGKVSVAVAPIAKTLGAASTALQKAASTRQVFTEVDLSVYGGVGAGIAPAVTFIFTNVTLGDQVSAAGGQAQETLTFVVSSARMVDHQNNRQTAITN